MKTFVPQGLSTQHSSTPGLLASPVGSWLRREMELTGGAGRAFRAGEHTASYYSGGHTSACTGHTHSKSSTKNGLRVNPGLRASMTCPWSRRACSGEGCGQYSGRCMRVGEGVWEALYFPLNFAASRKIL